MPGFNKMAVRVSSPSSSKANGFTNPWDFVELHIAVRLPWVGLSVCIPDKPPGRLVLPVWGPHFE